MVVGNSRCRESVSRVPRDAHSLLGALPDSSFIGFGTSSIAWSAAARAMTDQ